jgi:hypothetical protein
MPTAPPCPTVLAGESTKLSVASYVSGSPGTYADITQRTTITGPEQSANQIDTTTLDTTGYRCYRPSQIIEPGTPRFTILWNDKDATHASLLSKFTSHEIDSYKLTFSDGATLVMDGFVQALTWSGMSLDSNVSLDVTVKLTGPIVLTVGTLVAAA